MGVWSDGKAQVLNLWSSRILDGHTSPFTVKDLSSGACPGAWQAVAELG